MRRFVVISLTLITACSSAVNVETSASEAPTPVTTEPPSSTTTTVTPQPPVTYPPAPAAGTGPLNPLTEEGLVGLLDSVFAGDTDGSHLIKVVEGGDVRAAWILADLLRFFQQGPIRDELVSAFTGLANIEFVPTGTSDFVWVTNNLIAWDTPAWDGYVEMKASIFTQIDPRWQIFFDEDHGMDWRLVSWGGVIADDRPFGDNGPCNCIPALDDPGTTEAAGGDWYPDDGVVFGLVVNGEAVALPIHQMEVHEMINLTLGGRDLGIPYCTLCGSAQAYFTDNVPGVDRVVLRTSGLLSRSNKVMYDLATQSVIDTFTGEAKTGPLGQEGIILEQTTVVSSRWDDWRRAHPDTQILAEDGGIGRRYRFNPLGDRDKFGPIFPVGDVDPRLAVQEPVVVVVAPDGTPIAFPVSTTREELIDSGDIVFEGLTITFTDGIRVFDSAGDELTTHQSFWFAWSQFHPTTLVWSAPDN